MKRLLNGIRVGVMFISGFIVFFSVLGVVPSQAGPEAVTDKGKVEQIAREYDLFSPDAFTYHFENKDVQYWAEQGASEEELRKQFQARKTVRELAQKTGYKVAAAQGELTAGNLSYWAERLAAGEHPEQIIFEFKELLKTQAEQLKLASDRGSRKEAVKSEKEIEALAAQFGLLKPNAYAWTFQEGDIIWYAYQGMTPDEINQEFAAKATVRKLAEKTGFRLADPSGKITAGDLSYWAEFLRQGNITEEQMEKIFLARAAKS